MGTKGETTFRLTDPEALRVLGAIIHETVDRLDGYPPLSEAGTTLEGLRVGAGAQFRGRITVCLQDGEEVNITIGEGARLEDVELGNNVVIGARASLQDCTVRSGTHIPDDMKVEGPGEIGSE